MLTKDKWIKRRELERKALEEAKVAAFVLAAKDLKGDQVGAAFVAALPRLRQFANAYTRPLLGTVSRIGEVVLLSGERRGGLKKE